MDKEQEAIKRMKLAAKISETYYKKPLLVCNSGGKDSLVVMEIAKRSGVNFEVQNSHTTADAPETVRYIKEQHKELEDRGIKAAISYPTYKGKPVSMWTLIPQKNMPPTRLARYCCAVLKETDGKGRAICTGVRNSESVARSERKFATVVGDKEHHQEVNFEDASELFEADKNRKFIEHDDKFIHSCKIQGKTSFQPIVDWSDRDVWEYIRAENLKYNPLYDEGFRRVGCIGCPMGGTCNQLKEFARWPKYKQMYIDAFARMLEALKVKGIQNKHMWSSAEGVFHWWVQDGFDENQMTIF